MMRGISFYCFRGLAVTSSNRTSPKKFSVFMPMCVFNCYRQQTVIPLSLPCLCVCICVRVCACVGPFFPGLENAGLHVYVCLRVCVCERCSAEYPLIQTEF